MTLDSLSLNDKMDSREDLPRVSVGSVQDWQKVRTNYNDAALSKMHEHMGNSKTLAREKDAILAHINHVYIPQTALTTFSLTLSAAYRQNLCTRPTQLAGKWE